jgi:hypothetical protein
MLAPGLLMGMSFGVLLTIVGTVWLGAWPTRVGPERML